MTFKSYCQKVLKQYKENIQTRFEQFISRPYGSIEPIKSCEEYRQGFTELLQKHNYYQFYGFCIGDLALLCGEEPCLKLTHWIDDKLIEIDVKLPTNVDVKFGELEDKLREKRKTDKEISMQNNSYLYKKYKKLKERIKELEAKLETN